jgi:hypothetical protein
LIASAHYDEKSYNLYLTMHSGEQYVYRDVPMDTYKRLESEGAYGSAGAFYNQSIKGQFRGDKGVFEFEPYPASPDPEDAFASATTSGDVYELTFTLDGKVRVEANDLIDAVNTFRRVLDESDWDVDSVRVLRAKEA